MSDLIQALSKQQAQQANIQNSSCLAKPLQLCLTNLSEYKNKAYLKALVKKIKESTIFL